MTFPFGETVVVYREVRDPVHGDITRGAQRTISGVALYPRTSTESQGPGTSNDLRTAIVTTGLTMLGPPGTVIDAHERVVAPDGTEWKVAGNPGRWRSPLTGWAPGDQIELERVEG